MPLGYLPVGSIKFLNLLCVLLFKVLKNTPYKKSSVKDFLSKCKQICRKTRDLFTFTKYMLNENLHFLCSNTRHCAKSVHNRSFSGPHFLAFGLNTERYRVRENADQSDSEYGHFSRSESFIYLFIFIYSLCLLSITILVTYTN